MIYRMCHQKLRNTLLTGLLTVRKHSGKEGKACSDNSDIVDGNMYSTIERT